MSRLFVCIASVLTATSSRFFSSCLYIYIYMIHIQVCMYVPDDSKMKKQQRKANLSCFSMPMLIDLSAILGEFCCALGVLNSNARSEECVSSAGMNEEYVSSAGRIRGHGQTNKLGKVNHLTCNPFLSLSRFHSIPVFPSILSCFSSLCQHIHPSKGNVHQQHA